MGEKGKGTNDGISGSGSTRQTAQGMGEGHLGKSYGVVRHSMRLCPALRGKTGSRSFHVDFVYFLECSIYSSSVCVSYVTSTMPAEIS